MRYTGRMMFDAISEAMGRTAGMFPSAWTCRGCARPLDADGMHPAELYAGTCTGLCYECEGKPLFVKETYVLDGAMRVSYPPSCPSWRRDREEFLAYADCATCGGGGIGSSDWMHGATYRHYCAACHNRFYAHPLRARAIRHRQRLYEAAERVWQSELARIARSMLPKRAPKRAVSALARDIAKSPRMAAIKRDLLARHKQACARLEPLSRRAYETVPAGAARAEAA